MSLKNLLLWEKWRPKNLQDIILLPRIREKFLTGVNTNYIFYGHYGTGKTTLARILIGKYSKDKAFLELNSSLFTSIETLRNEVEKFCKTQPILETEDPIKYVFLDEFERVSPQYQDALKAFIEQYHKNVRFILTTNHIGKISDGIKSRFTLINFDTIDPSEDKYLKQEIYKKIIGLICPAENFEISKDNLVQIINKKFPDFRSILVELQNFKETGKINELSQSVSDKLKIELYSLLFDKSLDYEQIYHFVMSNFGPEKVDVIFNFLSRGLVNWTITNKKDLVTKLFEINYIISENHFKLDSQTDPVILAMTVIGKIRDVVCK
jgi:DNA polymerase III delta prime subunit